MGKTSRDDSPYFPPQVRESCFEDEAKANELSIVPSGFSFKFVFFAIACNLMFASTAELMGSSGGRERFGAEIVVFFGSAALNFTLVLLGLLSIGCVKLGKKSLNLRRALKHVVLTTFLCYAVLMSIYFYRGGQFLLY